MRAWLAIAWLAGCNQLLGIKSTQKQQPDAPVPPSDDEDGDGIANEHDDCPGVYDPMQVDSDGDGVGDLCDPHPMTFGDKLVLVEYFNGPTYSWTPDSAAHWMLDSMGSLNTTAAPEMTQASLQLTLITPLTSPTAEVGFTIVKDAPASMPLNRHMDLALDIPNDLAACHLATNGPSGPDVDEIALTLNGGFELSVAATAPVGGANRWFFTFDATAQTGTINGAQATFSAAAKGPATGVSLTVANFAVSVQYALIYDFNP